MCVCIYTYLYLYIDIYLYIYIYIYMSDEQQTWESAAKKKKNPEYKAAESHHPVLAS